MPIIKIDYNQELLNDTQMSELVGRLVKESMRIYDCGEDKISIFTASYGKYYFSTAAVEIEVRVKLSEYIRVNVDRDGLRLEHIAEYKKYLSTFIAEQTLAKGIVFTITFEDWQVEWLPGTEKG